MPRAVPTVRPVVGPVVGPVEPVGAELEPTPRAGRVWAYKGNPVYTHTRDRGPGRVGGDKWAAGVGGGGGGWIPVPRRRDLEE